MGFYHGTKARACLASVYLCYTSLIAGAAEITAAHNMEQTMTITKIQQTERDRQLGLSMTMDEDLVHDMTLDAISTRTEVIGRMAGRPLMIVTSLPGSYGKIHPEWERVSVDWGNITIEHDDDMTGGFELERYDARWLDPLGVEIHVQAIIALVGDEKRVFYWGQRDHHGVSVVEHDARVAACTWIGEQLS